MAHLPNIRHLSLPTTTLSEKDYSQLRTSDPTSRAQALSTAARSEQNTILELAKKSRDSALQTMTFVRPASVDDSTDSGIEYYISHSSGSFKGAQVQVRSVVCNAAAGVHDALPRAVPTPPAGILNYILNLPRLPMREFVPTSEGLVVVGLSGLLACGVSKVLAGSGC